MPLLLGVLYHAARQFFTRDMPYYAAAFSYYAPLALIPLVLFSLLVASFFYSPSFVASIFQSWGTVLGDDLLALINVAVQNLDIEIKSYEVPFIATAFFLSVSIFAFNVLGTGFERMWNIHHTGIRSWLVQTVRSASFVIILEAYMIFIIGAEGLLSYFEIREIIFLPEIIWLLSVSAVFMLLYRFLVYHSPSWRGCAFAGVVSGVLFLFANSILTVYLAAKPVLSIFGAAGLLLVLLIWVYILASIMLYGAGVAELYDKMVATGPIMNKK
jgi:membrane protein